jgi:hypothetical protein
MHHVEACEVEPQLTRLTVRLLALRRNNELQAAQLRAAVPLLLAGIISEVPGAALEFGMRSNADGVVVVDLTAEAGDATAAVADEMAAVLQPLAETAIGPSDLTAADIQWPVIADSSRGRLGFTAPGHRAISHLRWALTDIDHVGDAAAALIGSGLRLAQCAPGAQTAMQLRAQTAAALHIDRPVDRLVRHPHLHIVGKIHRQPPSDLLGAVVVL